MNETELPVVIVVGVLHCIGSEVCFYGHDTVHCTTTTIRSSFVCRQCRHMPRPQSVDNKSMCLSFYLSTWHHKQQQPNNFLTLAITVTVCYIGNALSLATFDCPYEKQQVTSDERLAKRGINMRMRSNDCST